MEEVDRTTVIGFGEILWDCFPDQRRPGGAPANFAYHVRQLGLGGVVCSRVGEDDLGDELVQYISDHGLSDEFVQRDPNHETGRVKIEFLDGQPQYTFVEDAAWDHLEVTDAARSLFQQANVVCFGTLGQRSPVSRESIQQCIALVSQSCLKVYDVNLRRPWFDRSWIEESLRAANLVKLNEDEATELAAMFDYKSEQPETIVRELQEQFDVDLVCVTRGSAGCLLANRQELVELPGRKADVVDTVGAGDSFTAALVYARLNNWELERSARFASELARHVVGKPGAMPQLDAVIEQLKREFA